MQFTIDKEFQSLVPTLTIEEKTQLIANLQAEGCRDPLVVWEEENILIDGHNRYEICTKYDIPFTLINRSFDSRESVKQWIAENQIGRRNLSADWMRYLVGFEYEKNKAPVGGDRRSDNYVQATSSESSGESTPLVSRSSERIAEKYGMNEKSVRESGKYYEAIETIVDQMGPDYRSKILDNQIKITTAEVKEIAELAPEKIQKFVNQLETGEVKNVREAKKVEQRENAAAIESLEPVEPSVVVEEGQWWQLGDHLLYCGDTSSPEFVDEIPQVQFAFADPPYNVGVDTWDSDFIWNHNWITEKAPVAAITPGHRGMEIFCANNIASDNPMKYRWGICCYITNGMKRGDLGYSNWIHVLLYGDGKIFRDAQDIVKVTINNAETEETSHRGRKPTELLISLIETFTEEGETVIDPFLGSGTTLLAAERTGRKCIGGEKEPLYCVEIIGRWELLTGLKAQLVESVVMV